MQLISLITSIFSVVGKDKIKLLITPLTAALKALKAKDVTAFLLALGQIVDILIGGSPTPQPTPGPGPVFAAADEGQFISACVAAGCDPADAQALVDELK